MDCKEGEHSLLLRENHNCHFLSFFIFRPSSIPFCTIRVPSAYIPLVYMDIIIIVVKVSKCFYICWSVATVLVLQESSLQSRTYPGISRLSQELVMKEVTPGMSGSSMSTPAAWRTSFLTHLACPTPVAKCGEYQPWMFLCVCRPLL